MQSGKTTVSVPGLCSVPLSHVNGWAVRNITIRAWFRSSLQVAVLSSSSRSHCDVSRSASRGVDTGMGGGEVSVGKSDVRKSTSRGVDTWRVGTSLG